MFSKKVRGGILAILIVALSLAPAAVQAGGRGSVRNDGKTAFSQVQVPESLFAALWRGLMGLFEKNGASIDPSGSPTPSGGTTSTPSSDEGASIDPNGGPHGG